MFTFLTRCPICFTTFRLTQEQMLLRDGKVRCGSCHHIFNAMEYLLEESAVQKVVPSARHPFLGISEREESHEQLIFPELLPFSEPEAAAVPASQSPRPETPTAPAPTYPHQTEIPAEPVPTHSPEPASPAPPEPSRPQATASWASTTSQVKLPDPIDIALKAEQEPDPPEETRVPPHREPAPPTPQNAPEAPGGSKRYGSLLDDLEPGVPRHALWPFFLAILALSLILAVQVGYYHRDKLSRHSPVAASLFRALGLNVSLARESEQISIEDSDLQVDPQTGSLQLFVALHNNATYVQAWPHLELTLTDAYDARLARRVFTPQDYLPASTAPAFAPGNTPVRLTLHVGDMPVSGYSLYLFYP
jgi:predicted Zn finger-like uncharacterized protein